MANFLHFLINILSLGLAVIVIIGDSPKTEPTPPEVPAAEEPKTISEELKEQQELKTIRAALLADLERNNK